MATAPTTARPPCTAAKTRTNGPDNLVAVIVSEAHSSGVESTRFFFSFFPRHKSVIVSEA
jgi:hypothetical protein